jgi:hypothetical protein
MFLKYLIFEFVLGDFCHFENRLQLELFSILETFIVLRIIFVMQLLLQSLSLERIGDFLMIESIHVTVAFIII